MTTIGIILFIITFALSGIALTFILYFKLRERKMEKEHAKRIELETVSRHFMIYYLQRNGSVDKAVQALNDAVKAAGIKATFIQNSETDAGWECDDLTELERAKQFRRELESCWPLGEYQREEQCVMFTIMRYQRK